MSACVCNERRTRERIPGLEGKDLPHNRATAWCGRCADGEWFFASTDHVLLYLAAGAGSTTPCTACLQAMQAVISAELGEDETDQS